MLSLLTATDSEVNDSLAENHNPSQKKINNNVVLFVRPTSNLLDLGADRFSDALSSLGDGSKQSSPGQRCKKTHIPVSSKTASLRQT